MTIAWARGRPPRTSQTITPAPGLTDEQSMAAQQLALTIAHELGVVGMLAVELMQRADGSVVVNELAMRPHNTGHWTIDGAHTSQFENHLRAVLDLPLGDPSARTPWTVMSKSCRPSHHMTSTSQPRRRASST